jgi:hypothetical protein
MNEAIAFLAMVGILTPLNRAMALLQASWHANRIKAKLKALAQQFQAGTSSRKQAASFLKDLARAKQIGLTDNAFWDDLVQQAIHSIAFQSDGLLDAQSNKRLIILCWFVDQRIIERPRQHERLFLSIGVEFLVRAPMKELNPVTQWNRNPIFYLLMNQTCHLVSSTTWIRALLTVAQLGFSEQSFRNSCECYLRMAAIDQFPPYDTRLIAVLFNYLDTAHWLNSTYVHRRGDMHPSYPLSLIRMLSHLPPLSNAQRTLVKDWYGEAWHSGYPQLE